jgi:hypothetical protein
LSQVWGSLRYDHIKLEADIFETVKKECKENLTEKCVGASSAKEIDKKQLVPVIEALKQAVAAGEVDQQLITAGAEVSSRFAKLLKH